MADEVRVTYNGVPRNALVVVDAAGGSGGGGAVTIADGADVTQGAIADSAYAGSGNSTVVSALKGLYAIFAAMSAKLPGSLGAKTGANSFSVVPATDAGLLLTNDLRAGTGTPTTVATSTTAVTVLAANANRKGGVVVNDSASDAYVLMATGTASSTVYTYPMAAKVGNISSTADIPAGYSGAISLILVSGTGNARVTEYT